MISLQDLEDETAKRQDKVKLAAIMVMAATAAVVVVVVTLSRLALAVANWTRCQPIDRGSSVTLAFRIQRNAIGFSSLYCFNAFFALW